ncbi:MULTISPECIES: tyrosine-type recombinase/integrase [unclassified Nonomuraea]|uniref:tyrosine-type recombinase/integrase n=1 Tax=unclassified Nonomuraea TaxID=2593643 RepID=UPI0033C5C142
MTDIPPHLNEPQPAPRAPVTGPPRRPSGRRRCAGLPRHPHPDPRRAQGTHGDFAQDGDDGLIFVGPDDGPLRNTNFNRRVWAKALQDADLPKIHFHDLRHTGNTLAASAGASIRELMARMGHSSTRAALIYQHSTDERQREVARKLDALARGALDMDPSGTERARP